MTDDLDDLDIMPEEHFVCRLIAEPTTGGRYRIRYGPLALARFRGRTIIFEGPKMLIPPDREFQRDEIETWIKEQMEAGYEHVIPGEILADAPLVEATRPDLDRLRPEPQGSGR